MNRKLMFTSNRGYLEIDFAVMFLIFIIFFSFVFLEFDSYIKRQNDILTINSFSADARDLCYLLTSSSGVPSNWQDGNINESAFLGLREANNFSLSGEKINAFNLSNYNAIIEKLNLDSNFNVEITGLLSNVSYLDFGPKMFSTRKFTEDFVCYSNYNSEIVKVRVKVWK